MPLWRWATGLLMVPLGVAALEGLVLPTVDSCTLVAWAIETRTYGRQGGPGRDGRPGRDGTPGADHTATANGTPNQFSLPGQDGAPGEAGENGRRPRCDSQPRQVAYDLQAPSGGNGGHGGRGGDGGQGGNLTLYYDNPDALGLITVVAPGGRGGRGGSGGAGASGCRCRWRSWTLQTCTGTPGHGDHRCQTNRYVCRDGRPGRHGSPGRDGRDGEAGQLRLVNQTTPLSADTPSQTLPLQHLVNQPLRLSRNLWTPRSGANTLLAAGSQVQDTYEDYTGRVEGTLVIDWQAPRPVGSFAAEPVTATIDADGRVEATFPEAVWIDANVQRQADELRLAITQAVREQDVTRMAWGGLHGSGSDLRAVVLDLAGESAQLQTQFQVTLRTTDGNPRDSHRLHYTTAYDDVVPAAAVTVTGNRFEIDLGQLPIPARRLRQGTYAQLDITAIRTLGPHSARQSIPWQGQL